MTDDIITKFVDELDKIGDFEVELEISKVVLTLSIGKVNNGISKCNDIARLMSERAYFQEKYPDFEVSWRVKK